MQLLQWFCTESQDLLTCWSVAENVLQVSQRQVGFGLHRLHDAYLSTTGRLVLKMTTKKEKFFFKRIENLTFFFSWKVPISTIVQREPNNAVSKDLVTVVRKNTLDRKLNRHLSWKERKDERRGAQRDHKQTRHNTNFVRKWSKVRGSRCR